MYIVNYVVQYELSCEYRIYSIVSRGL